jgi:hypothetical protein
VVRRAGEGRLVQANRVNESRNDEACEEFVIRRGDFSSNPKRIFARRSTEQVAGHAFDGGEIGRRMIGSDPALVMALSR